MWKEVAILILLIVTGSSWACWQINSPYKTTSTDAAFGIFVTVIGSAMTILVLDQLWFAEDRRKWRKIRSKVDAMCRDEISDLFTDFCTILVPPKVFTIESKSEEEGRVELMRKTREYQLEELDRSAKGDWKQIRQRLIDEKHLLGGEYGTLFIHRFENLNNIELKYGRFLEPSKLAPMIDLERLLESIDGNINVRLKWNVPATEDKIAYRVHELLKTLVECKRIGLLDIQAQ